MLSGYAVEETMALLAPSSILAAAVMVFSVLLTVSWDRIYSSHGSPMREELRVAGSQGEVKHVWAV